MNDRRGRDRRDDNDEYAKHNNNARRLKSVGATETHWGPPSPWSCDRGLGVAVSVGDGGGGDEGTAATHLIIIP